MTYLHAYRAVSALELVVGVTYLLAIGALAVSFRRSPAFKQRAAELTLLITLVWTGLALIPFPRVVGDIFNRPMVRSNLIVEPLSIGTQMETPREGVATESAKRLNPRPPLDSSPNPGHPNDRRHDWTGAITTGWFLVSGCLLVWIAGARVAIAVACARSRPAPPGVENIYASMKMRTRARVLISKRHARPMSFGVFRPVIMLPENLLEQSENRTLRHVLLHEQVHIDRRDAIGNAILIASLPILWWQPLYWYLRHSIGVSRELIADDVAANQSDKLAYVDDLIELIRKPGLAWPGAMGTVGVLGFRHPFTRRMSALMDRTTPLSTGVGPRQSVLMSMTAVVVLALAAASVGADHGGNQDRSDMERSAENATETHEPRSAEPPIVAEATPKPFRFPDGLVRAAADLSVTAHDDGTIVEIHVVPGQMVQKGDLLITMQNSELEHAVAEASQNLLILEQQVATNANYRDAQMSLKIARYQLAVAARNPKQTARDLTDLEQTVASSELRVELAKSQQARLELELQRDQLLMNQLQNRAKRLQVRAPADGTIESLDVNDGQAIHRGKDLLRLVSLEKFKIEFDVPCNEVFAPQLLQQDVSVTITYPVQSPIQLSGTVTFISSEVDLRGCVLAWAVCNNVRRDGHWLVRPGMRADVNIGLPETEAVPLESNMTGRDAGKHDALDALDQQAADSLEELIAWQTMHVKSVQHQVENGIVSKHKESLVTRDLWRSKAELAVVLGKHQDARKAYENAIRFAESAEAGLQMNMDRGHGDASELSTANRLKTEIQLDYLRYQRSRASQP